MLIDAKWESLALAPVGDAANPNDYFLFTAVRTHFLYHITYLHFSGRQRLFEHARNL